MSQFPTGKSANKGGSSGGLYPQPAPGPGGSKGSGGGKGDSRAQPRLQTARGPAVRQVPAVQNSPTMQTQGVAPTPPQPADQSVWERINAAANAGAKVGW